MTDYKTLILQEHILKSLSKSPKKDKRLKNLYIRPLEQKSMKVNIYFPLHQKMTPKRTNIEKPLNSNQIIHTTFSTTVHMLIDMLENIKLRNREITNYVRSTMQQEASHKTQNLIASVNQKGS